MYKRQLLPTSSDPVTSPTPASRALRRVAVYRANWLQMCIRDSSITENCQAKDSNNEPIPGLYITGDMSGSFFQNNYPCVMGGTACGRTLTLSLIHI